MLNFTKGKVSDPGANLIIGDQPLLKRFFVYKGKPYSRFLDFIGIPCPLDELNREQITIINRVREDLLKKGHLSTPLCRDIFRNILSTISPKSLLEIGCGKFPLDGLPLDCIVTYDEIDSEAVEFLEKSGLSIFDEKNNDIKFDLIFGIHVAHFYLDIEYLYHILLRLNPSGCFIMNFIHGNTSMPIKIINLITSLYLNIRVIKPIASSNNEWYILASDSKETLYKATSSIDLYKII